MGITTIDVWFHVGGKIVDNDNTCPRYIGGTVGRFFIDIDKIAYFELAGLAYDLGCPSVEGIYVKRSNSFEPLRTDSDVFKYFDKIKYGEEVHLYVVPFDNLILEGGNNVNLDRDSVREDIGEVVVEVERQGVIEREEVEAGRESEVEIPHNIGEACGLEDNIRVTDFNCEIHIEGEGGIEIDSRDDDIQDGDLVVEAGDSGGESGESDESIDSEDHIGSDDDENQKIDNELSDVDQELVTARETLNSYRRSRSKSHRAKNTIDIPLGEAGIDPGFEDIYGGGRRNYQGKLGGDEDYIGSSDAKSFESEAEGDGDNGDNLPKRRQRHRVHYDPASRQVVWQLGMVFENVKQFREAVTQYSLQRGVTVELRPNEPKRVRVKCNKEGCPWLLFASVDGKSSNFIIKNYVPVHKCSKLTKNRLCNSNFIAKMYKNAICRQPGIRLWQLQEDIKNDWKVYTSKSVCRRAKIKVMTDFMGDYTLEFRRLYDYRDLILANNPGSTCIVKVNKEEQPGKLLFSGFYMCLNAVKKGFLEGCRKCIGLDGCFLKGVCKGQLLVAVAKDGNHQMFPIAWAMVNYETKISWSWFISLLKLDLDMKDGDHYTIITDMQKGLIPAIEEILPNAEHRMCARHILANWQKKWRGVERRKKFWKCARSTFEAELKDRLQDLSLLGINIVEDLLYYNKETWCRAYFRDTSKCDVVDNNMSETFNAWILAARHKSVITLMEEIRIKMMNRMTDMREFSTTWISEWSPMAMKKLQEHQQLSMECRITWNGDAGFEVEESEYKHTVDLKKLTCSCRAWGMSGIPCPHAICSMHKLNMEPTAYMSSWYHKDTYLKAYHYFIQPVTNIKMWPETSNSPIEPPHIKRMPGRPKRNRRREVNESKTYGKKSRKGVAMTCSICKREGHNKKSCNNKSQGAETGQSMAGGSTVGESNVGGSTGSIRGRGRGRKATIMRGGRGMSIGRGQTPSTSHQLYGQKRNNIEGHGIFVAKSGFTCLNIGRQGHKVISTGARNIKSSSDVTGDIGFKPHGLKWKGKDAITGRQLQQKKDHQKRSYANRSRAIRIQESRIQPNSSTSFVQASQISATTSKE